MNSRITQYIIADDQMNAWEDENIDDSPQRESLYEAVHDAWFDLHEEETKSLLLAHNLSLSQDPRTLNLLSTYLRDNRWFVRRSAVHEIGGVVQEKTVELLMNALNDENSFVRHSAIRALGLIADHRATPILRVMLNQEDGVSKDYLIKSLHRINIFDMPNGVLFGSNEKYKEYLCYVIEDTHWFNRRYAAHWLGKVGTRKDLSLLLNALGDENSGVRYASAKALGFVRSYESLEPLQKLLSDTNSIVAGAAMGSITLIEKWGESKSDFLR